MLASTTSISILLEPDEHFTYVPNRCHLLNRMVTEKPCLVSLLRLHALSLRCLNIQRRHTQVLPLLRMAGKQQYLMPAGRIKQDAFHVFQAAAVTVHQGIVQYDQRWPSGFPQQIGVGQTANQTNLFPGAKAQFSDLPQFGPPGESARP